MSLRLRFALLFTIFVAIVLLISSVTIYILYFNYRQADFYELVKSEGLEFYDFVTKIATPKNKISSKNVQMLHETILWDETLLLIDSTGKVIDKIPDTLSYSIKPAFLNHIKKIGEHRYLDNQRQYVAMYIPQTHHYIIASGVDVVGMNKLADLRIILTMVFLGGLLITALFSFFFVNGALKPLRLLSTQMKYTTEQNLNKRLPERKTHDELWQIAQNFNEMLSRLNKAFENQKSFVHHASHELRTPLASMLSQTESALNKKLTEQEYVLVLQSLKEDELNLIELTNALLLLSQYEKMNESTQWPKIRIDELIYETMANVQKMIPDDTVLFQFSSLPDDEEDIMVQGNDALLKVAMINLIKNGINYSNDRKVLITIVPEKSVMKIQFENSGTVLTEAESNNMMVPFFRGANVQKVKGYGLGLSIVQRILQLHQGSLLYTAVNNSINRFTIVLPKA
ncbi:MAG: HAMP domain-containing protein [Hydrotalea flava]|uniref:HAMP domain-containing sensor histidine kinase n=1 Tax=unclassified Hydrotalea TaxID=2643788 RepID=UPI0010286BB7|nr:MULTISPECIES: HAMP domain-containing sensor histidine kinase [unclassified Hydrotalea]NIM36005.1 HAMP domain-containing protein [Hydrotalea flava]NIM38852.1 HAMP domain-containing protein [Hydrotalea flava]NIN04042.1 HAMP domain-containing protein [Hydrotalea flava]NIN15747.1 HAMP domain-containing protein [Hydrotalea flava]NIO94778.1 HAMP domain-containing protein [Hydrotalea flava]